MKHTYRQLLVQRVLRVAPRAGAWIETSLIPSIRIAGVSPPARGRGLKLHVVDQHTHRPIVSPPARGRGLKHRASATTRNVSRRPPRGGVD